MYDENTAARLLEKDAEIDRNQLRTKRGIRSYNLVNEYPPNSA
jgi:hypothetical protein